MSSGQSFVAEHWLDRFSDLRIRADPGGAPTCLSKLAPLRLAKDLDIALPGTTLAGSFFSV